MSQVIDKSGAHLLPQWYLVLLSTYGCGFNAIWGALLTVGFATHAEVLSLAIGCDTAKLIGYTMGAGAIWATVVPLIAGGLSDRCKSKWGKRKPYMFYGTVIALLGLGMMSNSALTDSLLFFVLGFVCLQLGMNTASGAYLGIIPDQVPDDQKGAASGYMNFMNLLGVVSGVLISGAFLSNLDKANPLIKTQLLYMYIGIGMVLSITLILTMLFMKDTPSEIEAPFNIREYVKSIWISPKDHPNFAWVWITRFMVMLGFYSLAPYLKLYLADVIHLKDTVTPLQTLMVLIIGGQAISSIISGFLSDKVGRINMLYVSNTLIAFFTLAFVFCENLTHVFIVGLLFGLFYGVYTTVDWALGTSVLPTKTNSGKEMAVWHVAITLPQAIGAPIAGFMLGLPGKEFIDGATQYTYMGYVMLMGCSALYFLLGAVGLKFIKGIR